MGNISSHTASFLGGGTLFAAVLGILATQFHMDAGLATDWLIVTGAVLGGPVMAYLSVKAKDDPALAAALGAIRIMQETQNGNGHAATPTPATTLSTIPTPEPPHV